VLTAANNSVIAILCFTTSLEAQLAYLKLTVCDMTYATSF